jgi:hypothetical protein
MEFLHLFSLEIHQILHLLLEERIDAVQGLLPSGLKDFGCLA